MDRHPSILISVFAHPSEKQKQTLFTEIIKTSDFHGHRLIRIRFVSAGQEPILSLILFLMNDPAEGFLSCFLQRQHAVQMKGQLLENTVL